MKKIYKKTFLLNFIIFFISFTIKIFQYNFLPQKYFYDSENILSLMNSYNTNADKAYDFTANFFKTINIFNFSSLLEWSVFLSMIFTMIIFLLLIRNKKYSIIQYIFIYSSVVLLNIYVFNLSKDIIQFIFFLALYFIIMFHNTSNNKKMIMISIVLFLEAIFFRIYYGIMILIMWNIYIIYNLLIKNKKKDIKIIKKIIVLILILFFFEVFMIQLLSVENYNSIINARLSVNLYRLDSTDAKTIINDLLGVNSSFFIFISNYIINLFRMLIPIELIFKGIKYTPFIIYQIFITYNIVKSSTKINDSNIMIFNSVISFLMISVIFEPDFGSFIRHESAMILFFVELNYISSKRRIVKLEKGKYNECNIYMQ